ncbi:MAG: exodeoxyribonuclease III [Rickettsiaceae bacterium]|nr:MAG: exodeoxyribonuclease III [Rickettsiaceae bacterium]
MKIITWNINSVRLRIGILEQLIVNYQPDVICLQEIKVENHLFPDQIIKNLGFKYLVFSGQKSYHGVAILSKFSISDSFSIEFYNLEKRHIAAKIKDIEIHNVYIPAGGDIPNQNENHKFKHKLEYIQQLKYWLVDNRCINDQIILLGDFNIAPYEHDVWSSKQLRYVVSHTDIERNLLLGLKNSMSFVDSARYFVPLEQKLYTWWSYRNLDWIKHNKGRRLDHIWVSSNMINKMKAANSITEARSWHRPSDHVPYILELYDQ